MKKITNNLVLTLLSLLMMLLIVGCSNSTQLGTLEKIKEEGKLVVGTEASYRPFEYHNAKDEIVGFDIDIAKALSKELGVELEIKDIAFDGLIPSLKTKKFDLVIAAMTITESRKKSVDFSTPYFNAGQVIAVLDSEDQIQNVEDLVGKTVGVQLGTTGDLKVSEIDGLEIKRYEKIPQAFIDLKNGRIDAIVNDLPVTATFVKKVEGVKIVGTPFTEENYGMAIRKDDNELEKRLNEALSNIKEKGIYDKIYAKWFK
ncbi:basic amino acid ABC transporter substrate-binding protein [Orenia marismortui]|uniref:Amino acid ABC transporter substrate-binding protein (PAAT family) n=1 Tax=Orenia marismortui TaxID=46469 RepID=A0A4R8H5G1_9FIRM|nr:basic amino acid ABC transporter substrate-binding protein [Orenia marismortui]TDX52449.1 amino acid ABC transporter substrate-binding protein (PAAT family) [Orenia marismortui]